MSRKLGFSAWLFVLLALLIHLTELDSAIYFTAKVTHYQDNVFQVFHDTGSGFVENDSSLHRALKKVPRQRNSRDFIRLFVEDYDFDASLLYFPLPPGKVENLRFDPGIKPGKVYLAEICLQNRFRRHCWQPEEIQREFIPVQQIASMRVVDGLLEIHSQGHDPYLVYGRGDFKALFASLTVADWPKKAALYFLALLFSGLMYFLASLAEKRLATPRPARPVPGAPRAENLFLLLGLVFGGLLVLLSPPFQASDEALHYARALHLSQGHLVAEQQQGKVGMNLPPHAIHTAVDLSSYYLDSPHPEVSNPHFLHFRDMPPTLYRQQFVATDIMYPPLPYLPHALGLALGQALDLSWLQNLYLGRWSGLLGWLLCLYLAIRLMPVGKWWMVLLALSPVPLYQAASFSADGLTTGFAFLFVALILRVALQPLVHPGRYLLAALGLAMALGLSKQPYVFLVLLCCLIPVRYLGDVRRYATLFATLLLLGAGSLGLWMFAIEHVYTAFQESHNNYRHLQVILGSPLDYLRVVVNTLRLFGLDIVESFIGKLGWFNLSTHYDLALPASLIYLHLGMLIFYALTDAHPDISLGWVQRLIIGAVFLIGSLIIFTALYLAATPSDNEYILGLQGRYFVPLAPLPFLLLYSRCLRIDRNIHALVASVYLPLLLGVLLVVMSRYYYDKYLVLPPIFG